MANDKYGNLIMHLRKIGLFQKTVWLIPTRFVKGVKWYDADSEEHGDYSQDFVTGLKHANW